MFLFYFQATQEYLGNLIEKMSKEERWTGEKKNDVYEIYLEKNRLKHKISVRLSHENQIIDYSKNDTKMFMEFVINKKGEKEKYKVFLLLSRKMMVKFIH